MAALAMLLAAGRPAAAQRLFSVGFAGGPSIPLGDLADQATTGWRAMGTLALGVPLLPIGLRFDAAHDRLPFERALAGSAAGDDDIAITSATANATLRVPMLGLPISPYLIGGAGAYRTSCSTAARCETSTRVGWNAGLGVSAGLLGIALFAEARVHAAKSDTSTRFVLPVTLGLRF